MSDINKKLKVYANYINQNNNETDSNFVKKSDEYRKEFLSSINEATIEELQPILKEYEFLVFAEDGIEMYKKYFSLGGKNQEILDEFIQYLYFWGPDFEDITVLIKSAIEDGDWNKINDIITKIKY